VVTQSNVETLENIKDQQVKTIGTLNEMRENDEKQLGKRIKDVKTLAQKNAELQAKVAELESTDETVRKYLNEPVPPVLGCMLSNSCTSTDDGTGLRSGTADPSEEPPDTLF
jgi:hypothetical protein